LYIRLSDNYPIIGCTTDTFFSGRKLFCRIFSGSKVEKSKKIPVESWPAQKFLARNPVVLKFFTDIMFCPASSAVTMSQHWNPAKTLPAKE